MIKSLAQNLPRNENLLKLLGKTLNLDLPTNEKRNRNKTPRLKPKKDLQPFNPERFPTFFKRRFQGKGGKEAVAIPIGGEKTIFFDTDVENNYFDRIEEPGELKIALLDFKTNETQGGSRSGRVDQIEDIFDARKSSPQDGTIKIHLSSKEKVHVGDEVRIKVSLAGPTGEFDDIFWAKISESKAPKQSTQKSDKKEIPNLRLPEPILVYQKDWKRVEEAIGETMDYSTIMHPDIKGETLEAIYINMDSTVLKNFKAKIQNPNAEQLETANRKYIAAVYFHTLFLYSITKANKYQIAHEGNDMDAPIELDTYLKDLFANHYAEFFLNFGAEEFMQLLED